MCGIFSSIQLSGQTDDEQEYDVQTSEFSTLREKLQSANAFRGPDAQEHHRVLLPPEKETASSTMELWFYASELRLRGDGAVVQPHRRGDTVLCWNGEIFEGMEIGPSENDGLELFERLYDACDSAQVLEIMGSVEGPYAFVFYHARTQHLYFGRDPLGRRSLLVHMPTPEHPYLFLTSVSTGPDSGYDMDELPTEDIYLVDVSKLRSVHNIADDLGAYMAPLPRYRSNGSSISPYARLSRVNTELPPPNHPSITSLNDLPVALHKPVDDFISHLDRSVMLRVRDVPHIGVEKGQARIAVLFSGGIDCTVLAFLAHRHLPLDESIDLLNVAFENPRKAVSKARGKPKSTRRRQSSLEVDSTDPPIPEEVKNADSDPYLVPDRVAGLREVAELRRLCPERAWNFIEVDVSFQESQTARPIVQGLMYPSRTVMDLSLAIALYFASRGMGRVRSNDGVNVSAYTSSARVLLNGLGADELLGGYGRHRTVYKHGGWPDLVLELQREIDRLPTRNLGRDDRVISVHGKETRHPFLALPVVSFLASLPVHTKLDPRLELGTGDKMLLRLAARQLGLVEASERRKKAMQFGSHSARMEGGEADKKGDVYLY